MGQVVEGVIAIFEAIMSGIIVSLVSFFVAMYVGNAIFSNGEFGPAICLASVI